MKCLLGVSYNDRTSYYSLAVKKVGTAEAGINHHFSLFSKLNFEICYSLVNSFINSRFYLLCSLYMKVKIECSFTKTKISSSNLSFLLSI